LQAALFLVFDRSGVANVRAACKNGINTVNLAFHRILVTSLVLSGAVAASTAGAVAQTAATITVTGGANQTVPVSAQIDATKNDPNFGLSAWQGANSTTPYLVAGAKPITVSVKDASGKPVVGAKVFLNCSAGAAPCLLSPGAAGAQLTTDADGNAVNDFGSGSPSFPSGVGALVAFPPFSGISPTAATIRIQVGTTTVTTALNVTAPVGAVGWNRATQAGATTALNETAPVGALPAPGGAPAAPAALTYALKYTKFTIPHNAPVSTTPYPMITVAVAAADGSPVTGRTISVSLSQLDRCWKTPGYSLPTKTVTLSGSSFTLQSLYSPKEICPTGAPIAGPVVSFTESGHTVTVTIPGVAEMP